LRGEIYNTWEKEKKRGHYNAHGLSKSICILGVGGGKCKTEPSKKTMKDD